jgi:hypothetical protein
MDPIGFILSPENGSRASVQNNIFLTNRQRKIPENTFKFIALRELCGLKPSNSALVLQYGRKSFPTL